MDLGMLVVPFTHPICYINEGEWCDNMFQTAGGYHVARWLVGMLKRVRTVLLEWRLHTKQRGEWSMKHLLWLILFRKLLATKEMGSRFDG